MKFTNKNYLLTKKIELGKEFGADDPDEFFVEFSELNTAEVLNLRKEGDEATGKILSLLASHIVSHNGYDEKGDLISNDRIMQMIKDKSVAAMKVIKEYSDWISDPFRTEKESS